MFFPSLSLSLFLNFFFLYTVEGRQLSRLHSKREFFYENEFIPKMKRNVVREVNITEGKLIREYILSDNFNFFFHEIECFPGYSGIFIF